MAYRYFDASGLLREGRYGDFERFLKDASATGHEIRCYDDALSFGAQVRDRELLRNRLRDRNWGHVLFHGDLTSMRRRQLVQQFREDPRCRLFLSTDAGGVGLNLQHADTVVNMDIPWNPAVLEQRIGRVHRLGQARPVQVVHFVAQGTIEHGMLDVLAFKSSLFSGVLDGGQSEVFLGGTRLKRFMESVEKVTESIPTSMPAQTAALSDETSAETEGAGLGSEQATASTSRPDSQTGGDREEHRVRAAATSAAAIAELASAGLAFFDKLASLIAPGATVESGTGIPAVAAPAPAVTLEQDPADGRPYLRLPLPDPKTLVQLRGWLAGLATLAGRESVHRSAGR